MKVSWNITDKTEPVIINCIGKYGSRGFECAAEEVEDKIAEVESSEWGKNLISVSVFN